MNYLKWLVLLSFFVGTLSGQEINIFSDPYTVPGGYDEEGNQIEYTYVDLNKSSFREIARKQPDRFEMRYAGHTIVFTKNKLFVEDFIIETQSGTSFKYKGPRVHYKGKFRNFERGLASLTISDDVHFMYDDGVQGGVKEVMPLEGSKSYIVKSPKYLKELVNPEDFLVADIGREPSEYDVDFHQNLRKQLKVSLVVDHDLYSRFGSVGIMDYIEILWNQVSTIYDREGVPIIINDLFLYDQSSPFSCTDLAKCLDQFVNQGNNFSGNVHTLLTLKSSGGIAYVDVLCLSGGQRKFSKSVCSMALDLDLVGDLTYSFDVMVVCHEIGHNIGSPHTHACFWNGNNTALDGCTRVEGNCARPGIPDVAGIMSYCHFYDRISFFVGFDVQPGNYIRQKIAEANCLEFESVDPNDEDDTSVELIPVEVSVTYDQYPSDISWELVMISDDSLIYWVDGLDRSLANQTASFSFDLPKGAYSFSIIDEFGDGLCCTHGSGSYLVRYKDGSVLANGSFRGSFVIEEFFVDPELNCVAIDVLGADSYVKSQDKGTLDYFSNNKGILLNGNSWKKIPINIEITEETVMDFDFAYVNESEIHAIGFSNDNGMAPTTIFQLAGTQKWALQDFNDYDTPGLYKKYSIPVGQFFTGKFKYLVFVSDHDWIYSLPGNSYFKDVIFHEGECGFSSNIVETISTVKP